MNLENFDLIVIGGGPGGYVAAIRAAQLGMKVVCIEKNKSLGGTCLNVGCIPSKSLLHSSHLYEVLQNDISKHGINISGEVKVNLKKMMESKNNSINSLTKGIDFLFKKNGVSKITGSATFLSEDIVLVDQKKFQSKNIIIATGSKPSSIPGIDVDENNISTSTGALSFSKVPKSLAVIGGGYIGLELGSVWRRLGSKVIVIEFLDRIVPTMDSDIAKLFKRELDKQGIEFKLNTKVTGVKKESKNILLSLNSSNDEPLEELNVEKVLVAVGRKPYTKGLGLEKLNLKMDNKGAIVVNKNFSTSISGIYAIGDVTTGPMLAHKASAEGHMLAEIISGKTSNINYDTIPAVVYTEPEVAWVGATEDDLKKSKIDYNVGSFPLSANSRAYTMGGYSGTVKILACAKTDRILGGHIIGPHAGELIGEIVVAMEMGVSSEDLALSCHAHPTLSESIKEAASIAYYGKGVHF
tara:strand:- start:1249 stop:2649 length:1401 start_codon:yes stop_codon:yes gene_type:complete